MKLSLSPLYLFIFMSAGQFPKPYLIIYTGSLSSPSVAFRLYTTHYSFNNPCYIYILTIPILFTVNKKRNTARSM